MGKGKEDPLFVSQAPSLCENSWQGHLLVWEATPTVFHIINGFFGVSWQLGGTWGEHILLSVCSLLSCRLLLEPELCKRVPTGPSKPELLHRTSGISDVASETRLCNVFGSLSSPSCSSSGFSCAGSCGRAKSRSTIPPSTGQWRTKEEVSRVSSW